MKEHTALVIAVREALKQTSMRKLAAKAGVSHTTISELVSGKSSDVSLSTYQALMDATATESNMRKPVTTHDHASATAEQVEQAALERGVNADLGGRDTELECAKYKRVMQLEAEVQAWREKAGQARQNAYALQERCKAYEEKIKEKDAWTEIVDDARKELQRLLSEAQAERDELRNKLKSYPAQIKDLEQLAKGNADNWRAVCAKNTELQKQLDHGQVKFNELWAAHKDWTQDEAEMREQIETLSKRLTEAKTHCTRLERDSNYARSIAWACGAALVMLVVLMAATAAKVQ
jgi:chromosome segregation ATPase